MLGNLCEYIIESNTATDCCDTWIILIKIEKQGQKRLET